MVQVAVHRNRCHFYFSFECGGMGVAEPRARDGVGEAVWPLLGRGKLT